MVKLRNAATIAAVTGLALLAGAAPAQAATTQASCSQAALFSSNAYVTYSVAGATQHWEEATYSFTGPQVGNKSNVNFRLRKSPDGVSRSTEDKLYFTYNSPDALQPDNTYTTPINRNVPLSEYIYVKFDTIFDLPVLPDINCFSYTPMV